MTIDQVLDILAARALLDRATSISVFGDLVSISLEPAPPPAPKPAESSTLTADERRVHVERIMYASADDE